MSRLPDRPSLEHLRKQAKERLAGLRRSEPSAKLADALHAVARESGFATWPQLKAHVESAAASAGHPFAGTWTADVSRSKRHPANQFRRATLQVTLDGDTVTITHVAVDAAGREEQGTSTVRVDDVEHPGTGGHALVARWAGPRILEVLDRRMGANVGGGTYEVSEDGRTLTVSSARGEQVIVLDRA
jgi:hypothetical protein